MSRSKRIALDSVRRTTTTMLARGLPRDVLRSRPFKLEEHAISITSEVEELATKRVKKQRQIDDYWDLCDNPFSKPYVSIFASFPNDMRAKVAAAYLMEIAVKKQLRGEAAKSKQLPLWHTINGSFQDRLRDGASDRPSLLILSTITKDSTNVKIEKLRDLLEQYANIPRVVVLTGIDPVTFANTRLYSALNYCLYLASSKRVEL